MSFDENAIGESDVGRKDNFTASITLLAYPQCKHSVSASSAMFHYVLRVMVTCRN